MLNSLIHLEMLPAGTRGVKLPGVQDLCLGEDPSVRLQ
jgi:hypothetical protein